MPIKVWDEITYPFRKGRDELFHPTLYNGCSCMSILILKLNHVSKGTPEKYLCHRGEEGQHRM